MIGSDDKSTAKAHRPQGKSPKPIWRNLNSFLRARAPKTGRPPFGMASAFNAFLDKSNLEAFFLDTCALPAAFPLVKQLRAANLTRLVNEDGFNIRGKNREEAFYTNSVGNLPDGERGSETATLALDNVAFKALDTFFITFDDFIVNGNVVPGFKFRELLGRGQLLVDKSYGVHDSKI